MASAGVVGVDNETIGERGRESGLENEFWRPSHESFGATRGLKTPSVGRCVAVGIVAVLAEKALPCLL